MDNSKDAAATDLASVKTCKGCKKVCSDFSILKHITHTSCNKHYTDEEMTYLRDLANERKKTKEKEYREKKREKE